MSPEQIKSSGDVDHRTDVWALGVVLHELVAGRPPFKKSVLSALYISITLDPAPPLRTLRPETPASLEAAVLRCLEKDVAQRMQSIVDLARALAPVAPSSARLSIERITRIAGASPFATTSSPPSAVDEHASTLAAPEGGASGPRTGSPGPWGSTAGRSGRGGLPGWAILVAGAAVLTGAGLVASRWGAGPSAAAAPDAAPVATSAAPVVAEPPSATAPSAHVPMEDAAAPVPPVIAKPRPPAPVRDAKKDASSPERNGLDDRN
jgi:serine/threonine-protein kinase